MVKNNQNLKPTNQQNHHNLKRKSQEEVVLSWVDHNVKETLTYTNNQVWFMMNRLYLSFITTYQQIKLTWLWSQLVIATKFNQSLAQGKFSTLIQFIYSTAYFSMDKTTRKSEGLSVVQDSCHMISWEKREINISIRANMLKHFNIMKGLYPYLSGLSIMSKKMIKDHNLMKNHFLNFHLIPSLLLILQNLFQTILKMFILIWMDKNKTSKKCLKKILNFKKWKQNIKNFSLFTQTVMLKFVMAKIWKMLLMLIWENH